jgi:hypothetical protein
VPLFVLFLLKFITHKRKEKKVKIEFEWHGYFQRKLNPPHPPPPPPPPKKKKRKRKKGTDKEELSCLRNVPLTLSNTSKLKINCAGILFSDVSNL